MAPPKLNTNDMGSATDGVSIAVNTAVQPPARGVWVGVTQSLDFSFDGSTWVTFSGCTAGTILPFRAVGARKTAAGAAPTAGDVVFLY